MPLPVVKAEESAEILNSAGYEVPSDSILAAPAKMTQFLPSKAVCAYIAVSNLRASWCVAHAGHVPPTPPTLVFISVGSMGNSVVVDRSAASIPTFPWDTPSSGENL